MKKIIWVRWFSDANHSIGIVVTENENKDNKAYLGVARGIDEEYDMEYIANWGAKFPLVSAALLMEQPGGSVKNYVLKTGGRSER